MTCLQREALWKLSYKQSHISNQYSKLEHECRLVVPHPTHIPGTKDLSGHYHIIESLHGATTLSYLLTHLFICTMEVTALKLKNFKD